MIKISYKEENNHIKYIKISGHANYADNGYDIVCASVSSIAITTINAIIMNDKTSIDYKEADGLLEINILKYSNFNDILMTNMIDLLQELEKQYKKNIKIGRLNP